MSRWPPLVPVVILIYCNFAFLFNFVLLETLSSTLAMDQVMMMMMIMIMIMILQWGWAPQAREIFCRKVD